MGQAGRWSGAGKEDGTLRLGLGGLSVCLCALFRTEHVSM